MVFLRGSYQIFFLRFVGNVFLTSNMTTLNTGSFLIIQVCMNKNIIYVLFFFFFVFLIVKIFQKNTSKNVFDYTFYNDSINKVDILNSPKVNIYHYELSTCINLIQLTILT